MKPWRKPLKLTGQKGFSLIELMVVIAIVGILVGIAMISMFHYIWVLRVNTSNRQLAGHLRVARALSLKQGWSVAVKFNTSATGTHSYEYGTDVGEDGAIDGNRRTYFLQSGIVFGLVDQIPPIPGIPYGGGSCPVLINTAVSGVDCTVKTLWFRRNGQMVSGSSQPRNLADAAIYLIPYMDFQSTGRDDRIRGTSVFGVSGSVRPMRYRPDLAGKWE